MFLDEALKIHRETGRKIRHSDCIVEGYYHPNEFVATTIKEALTVGWEVAPDQVTVTRESLAEAWDRANQNLARAETGLRKYREDFFRFFCKELGL